MPDTGPFQIHSKAEETVKNVSTDEQCHSSRIWWLAGLPLIGYLFVMISRHPYLSLGTLAVAGYGVFWYLSRSRKHWDRLVIGSNSLFRLVLGKIGLKLVEETEKDAKSPPPVIVLETNAARESALALGPFDLPDDDSIIRFDEPGDQSAPGGPKLKAATEVKLIERLCYYPILDSDFTTTFLITYRSFTTPDVLLELLIRRYNEQPPSPNPTAAKAPTAVDDLRPRVCNILKLWVSEFWKDFETDTALRAVLFNFVNDQVVGKDGVKFGSHLQSLIKDKTDAENISRQHKRQSTVLVDLQHLPPACENRDQLFEKILAVDVEQLAQQITLIESRLFGSIPVFEFLDQNWAKKTGKAPQILKKIDSFNRMNAFVVTHIVCTGKIKDRARVIKRYIRLASECKKIHNYDTTMAIISALQGASAGRLASTWAEVAKAARTTFNELTDFINPKSNYKNYRTELSSHTGPVVPYMGVWLSDLTFIDDGNPKFIFSGTPPQNGSEPSSEMGGNRLVNFDKCRMVSKCLRSIHSTQLVQYRMVGLKEIQELIMEFHAPGVGLSESEAYKCSLSCEKRRPTSS